jgi:hypothetical protein
MNKIKKIYHLIKEYYLGQFVNDLQTEFAKNHDPIVSFLGCGAQKSGTSALDNYLRQHPEICLPDQKEIHYFDNEYNFRYHNVNYLKYHSFFQRSIKHKIAGEVTPAYMYWDNAMSRIWEYNPQMRILILLRNPIRRAYSHWNMNRIKGIEEHTFLEAVSSREERMRVNLPFQNKKFAYLDRGFYSSQIRRIYRFFPEEQVLIKQSAALAQQPVQTMSEIFEFLGVEPLTIQKEEPIHEGTYERPMSDEEREFLLEFYRFEIKEVEKLLGWDCSNWLIPNPKG